MQGASWGNFENIETNKDEIREDRFSRRGHLRFADPRADLFHGGKNRAGNAARDYSSGIFLGISGSGPGLASVVSGAVERSGAIPRDDPAVHS